jgi:hypothetical protein
MRSSYQQQCSLAKVLRVILQAVVDHVLHVLRNHHHGAVALTAVDPLGFCRLSCLASGLALLIGLAR